MHSSNHKKIIGVVLFSVALFLIVFTAGRAYYWAGSDAGISATNTAIIAAQAAIDTAPQESLPKKLVIPKLGINADVQHLGVTSKGLMAAPKNFTDVSWFKLGTLPGETGSAVMAGHEDNALSLDGVFKHLEDLKVGDDVYVDQENGERLHFRVIKMEIQPYNLTGPVLNDIFSRSDGRYLNLITCAGDWLPEAKTNDKRLIVYTKLVSN